MEARRVTRDVAHSMHIDFLTPTATRPPHTLCESLYHILGIGVCSLSCPAFPSYRAMPEGSREEYAKGHWSAP